MPTDDLPYLRSIAKVIGAKHFGVAGMFKAAYPRKHGSWTVFMQDDLKKIMGHLVRDGLAAESTGPRGGAGWKLTEAGISLGLKN